MFGLVGDFKSMMSHLGVCWGPLVIKFQSQRTHGSVGIEFGVGFGRLLSHWTVCWAFVGTFWGYVVLLLGVLGSVGGFWGENFNPNGRMFPLGLKLGSVSGVCYAIGGSVGGCWAILGLCWAFVGPFAVLLAAFRCKISIPTDACFCWEWNLGWFRASVGHWRYVEPLLGHFRVILGICWVIWDSSGGFRSQNFEPQPKHGLVEVAICVHFELMLGHLASLCCAVLKLSVGHSSKPPDTKFSLKVWCSIGSYWVHMVILVAFVYSGHSDYTLYYHRLSYNIDIA